MLSSHFHQHQPSAISHQPSEDQDRTDTGSLSITAHVQLPALDIDIVQVASPSMSYLCHIISSKVLFPRYLLPTYLLLIHITYLSSIGFRSRIKLYLTKRKWTDVIKYSRPRQGCSSAHILPVSSLSTDQEIIQESLSPGPQCPYRPAALLPARRMVLRGVYRE